MRVLIEIPNRARRTIFGAIEHAVKGMIYSSWFWAKARRVGVPGKFARDWSLRFGIKALFSVKNRLPLRDIFHFLFMPMESTRYFELEFVLDSVKDLRPQRYLDVSSPRLVPLCVVDQMHPPCADLLNPDKNDLSTTAKVIRAAGLEHLCHMHSALISDAEFAPGTFDLITSVSVLEHIPDDEAALRSLWDLLRPGGRLVLTLPCMAKASDQYVDKDYWGILPKTDDGYTFFQRLYDQRALERKLYSVVGRPAHMIVYGEKTAGAMLTNSHRKRANPYYPYWEEPYFMATEFRYFGSLSELPGEGVVGLVFVK